MKFDYNVKHYLNVFKLKILFFLLVTYENEWKIVFFLITF